MRGPSNDMNETAPPGPRPRLCPVRVASAASAIATTETDLVSEVTFFSLFHITSIRSLQLSRPENADLKNNYKFPLRIFPYIFCSYVRQYDSMAYV